MNIKGEYLGDALEKWHPLQEVNVYDTASSGEFVATWQIDQVPQEEKQNTWYFAEPVDENGEYTNPKLKD